MTDTDMTAKNAPSPDAYYKWAVVGMLWFVCFFNYADRQAVYSVFPKFQEEFGFDAVQLGMIGSAFMWVYAFGSPFAGLIADRVSRKHLILGGCLFWSGVTVMTGWCSRLWHFVTVRALEGVGETFYFPASMSLMGDYHDQRTRSKAFSIHQSAVYAGTIGGSWLGAWFAEHYGWRWGFYFFGGVGAVLALVLYRHLRDRPRGAAEMRVAPTDLVEPLAALSVRETARVLLRKPTVWLLLLGFMSANFVATIFLTWTPYFLVEKFHFKLTSAGLSGSVFIHLASALSAPLAGILADRWAARVPGGRMLMQATGLLCGTVFVAAVGLTHDITTLLVAMAGFGFCKGLYDANTFASLYDVVEPRARASATGLMNMIGWGGGALGPLAVGLATKYGRHEAQMDNMSEAIAFGGVIYLVGAGMLLLAGLHYVRLDRVSLSAVKRSEVPFH